MEKNVLVSKENDFEALYKFVPRRVARIKTRMFAVIDS
jgi:hypothetical protein